MDRLLTGDTSGFAYVLFGLAILGVLVMYVDTKKHKFPRTVLFFYCTLPFVLGLVMLIMTCIGFNSGEVCPIFLKTCLHPVEKLDSPVLFYVGLIFNILFCLAIIIGSLFGMFKAITDTKFRFKG